MRNPKVVLTSLPWTSLTEPSLGLGILKSKLDSVGIDSKVCHLNLLLLKYVSSPTYINFANIFALNEFLFTYFFESNLSEEQLLELSLKIEDIVSNNNFNDPRYQTRESLAKLILNLRNQIIPNYILECVNLIELQNPTMIGFTCMFDQTIPSLAVAKLLKIRNPDLFIVLGGYALEGIVGEQIIESFNFIDCVAFGEGEKVIVELAKASIDKQLLENIPDIIYREKNFENPLKSKFSKPQIKLDDSPCPNYDDFAEDLNNLFRNEQIKINWNTIPIETSRGCWWGQKNHCIFCGIDDVTMRYREKSGENTICTLEFLSNRYSISNFRISDYILPNTFYSSLLPKLVDKDYLFTCEIKSNIKDEQFALLSKSGFIEVQPGIESFSTSILQKINKGVTAIQNVYCIKLGLVYNVKVNYNLLYGFPEDENEEYKQMLKLMPFLYHLDPPSSRVKVAITRFAPLHNSPEKYNLKKDPRHHRGYDLLFSKSFLKESNLDLANICYYFENEISNSYELENLYKILEIQADYWRNAHQTRDIYLTYEIIGDQIFFKDTRYSDKPREFVFGSTVKEIFLMCEKIISKKQLIKLCSIENDELIRSIDLLLEHRLIMNENDKYLSLAIDKNINERTKKQSNKWAKPFI